MKTEKLPYELLVRWGEDGAIRGAHVIFAYRVTDGDEVVSYQPGTAVPAGERGAGFPLSTAVTKALAAGLAAAAPKLAEYDALLAERDALLAAINDAKRQTQP